MRMRLLSGGLITMAAVAAMAVCAAARAAEEPRIVPIGMGWARTTVNTTTFRSEAVTTHGQTQYAAFYDVDSQVVLARRTLGSDKWDLRQTSLTGNTRDAHNSISIAVDGDGYLHVSWDHHCHALRYVQSRAPGSLELTEKMPMTGQAESRVTYPEFIRLPDGDLVFMYRDGGSGNGRTMLNRFDLKTRRWSVVQHPLIDGRGKNNAYTNRLAIGADGVWHLSWCWRETPDLATNHDVCYARSADEGRTWTKSTGQPYALPITEDTAEVVVAVPEGSQLINQTSMAADSRGRPVIATYWRPVGQEAAQVHVIRRDEAGWRVVQVTDRRLPFTFATGGGTRRKTLSRPAIAIDAADRIYLLIRDEERGGKVSALISQDADLAAWRTVDLTSESFGQYEANYDRVLWKRDGLLHIFIQRSEQGDGERPSDLGAQPVGVLEWKP